MRRILGIVAGIAAAWLIVSACDWLTFRLAPIPELDSDAAVANLIAGMPVGAKLVTVGGWVLAPLCGAWLALRICDWRAAGWIAAAFVLAINGINIYLLPHPVWMEVCAVLLPVIGGRIGIRLHHKPYPGEPLLG